MILPTRELEIDLKNLREELFLIADVPGVYLFCVIDEKLRKIEAMENLSLLHIITFTSRKGEFARMLLIGDELVPKTEDSEEILKKIYELK